MATERVSYVIDLEGSSNIADVAALGADGLQKLQDELLGSMRELRNMQAAQRNLKGSSAFSAGEMQAFSKRIKEQRDSIAQLQASYVRAGGSFKTAAKPPKIEPPDNEALRGYQELLKKVSQLNPRVAGLTARLPPLSANMMLVAIGAAAAAVAVLAVAAALVKITAETVKATAALVRYGIAQANARKAEQLRLEGMTKIRYYNSGFGFGALPADDVGFLQKQIDKVSSSVAISRDKVADYERQLYRMGLRSGNLADALEAVSIVAATQGDEQANIFASWAAGAAITGQSVKKLSDDVKARLGGIAKQQMLDLDVQQMKLRENFDRLFDGINVNPFAIAFKAVADLMSQATYSGQALKQLIEDLFKPLGANAEATGMIIRRFFQGLIIGALRVRIVLLQAENWWLRAFGSSKIMQAFDLQNAAVKMGEIALYGLMGALALTVGMVGLLVSSVVTFASFVAAQYAAVGAAIYGHYLLIKTVVTELFELWDSIDWTGLGNAIVDGLVNGLTAGWEKVKGAVKDLGSAAYNEFKSFFKIASPSKLMNNEVGYQIGAGQAEGMHRSNKLVAAEARNMGKLALDQSQQAVNGAGGSASAGATGSSGAGGAAASPKIQLTISELNVQARSEDPKEFARSLKEELTKLLEGAAIEAGAI